MGRLDPFAAPFGCDRYLRAPWEGSHLALITSLKQ
jgi:hypothetical protein